MPRLILPAAAVATVGLALLPAAASADVSVRVPVRFLGAPLPFARPVVAPAPAPAPPAEAAAVQPEDPADVPTLPDDFFADPPAEVPDPIWPERGDPQLAPPELPDIGCDGENPADCVVLGPEADLDADAPLPDPGPNRVGVVGEDDPGIRVPLPLPTPEDPASPAAPGATSPGATTAAGNAIPTIGLGELRAPDFATWLRRETVRLSWTPTPGASHYGVQIFQGGRRVLKAWPEAAGLVVPAAALDQGRYYTWVVYPGYGERAEGRYGPALGRSVFGVILRPRLVFHPVGPRSRRQVVAEVRPHIPLARVRLEAPRALRRLVPGTVRLDGAGRVRLRIDSRAADGLRARLVSIGPRPPKGLR